MSAKDERTDQLAKWEVQELVDDAIATDQWHPALINEYVYEMKIQGRPVRDLTAASYHQLALNRGITTEEVIREDKPRGVMYTVKVKDPNGLEKYGVAYEYYFDNKGVPDKFCYQKALTKATRNAIKQLIDATERVNAIEALMNIGKEGGKKS